MKKMLAALACAAALCAGGASHAAVLTFDDPGLIDIDNNTGIATYTESGFALAGPAASFLLLDAALVGDTDGANGILSLKAVGGAAFALLSMDYAFYDLGFGADPGTLSVIGLLNGVQVASQTLTLGSLKSFSFGAGFAGLTEVDFIGTTAFALDNVNAVAVNAPPVPEPATVALMATGLLGLMLQARRRRKAS